MRLQTIHKIVLGQDYLEVAAEESEEKKISPDAEIVHAENEILSSVGVCVPTRPPHGEEGSGSIVAEHTAVLGIGVANLGLRFWLRWPLESLRWRFLTLRGGGGDAILPILSYGARHRLLYRGAVSHIAYHSTVELFDMFETLCLPPLTQWIGWLSSNEDLHSILTSAATFVFWACAHFVGFPFYFSSLLQIVNVYVPPQVFPLVIRFRQARYFKYLAGTFVTFETECVIRRNITHYVQSQLALVTHGSDRLNVSMPVNFFSSFIANIFTTIVCLPMNVILLRSILQAVDPGAAIPVFSLGPSSNLILALKALFLEWTIDYGVFHLTFLVARITRKTLAKSDWSVLKEHD